eukprot:2336763-Amphidinium_carterae.3
MACSFGEWQPNPTGLRREGSSEPLAGVHSRFDLRPWFQSFSPWSQRMGRGGGHGRALLPEVRRINEF